MPAVTRTGDISIGICACCCSGCPHVWVSVHIVGSPDTFTNARETMRAPGDLGACTCPHCPISYSLTGASISYINNLRIHRLGDIHIVPCGTGVVVSASPDTFCEGY